MEEYLKTLLEQVRCKKAHPMIEKEVRGHIEEQREANRAAGMKEEEALRLAVLDMGDPVEAGVELDRVHRPRMAWDLIVVMAVIGLASIVIHAAIGMGAENVADQTGHAYTIRAIGYVGLGFLLMLLVCRIDYSILAKWGVAFACVFLAAMTLEICFFGINLNGRMSFLRIGNLNISLLYLMFLYIPLYGAVLYRFRGSGFWGILKSIGFLLYPIWLAFRMPCDSLALQLLLVMSVMLTAAVIKDWFLVPKKVFLAVYWGIVAFMPAMFVFISVSTARLIPSYQQARIEAFLSGGAGEYDYVARMLSVCLKNSRLFGAGGDKIAGLPDYYSDYILTFLAGSYGMAIALFIYLLAGVIVVKAFRIAFRQRNQLGMMIGMGSALVLFVNTLLNVMENFGALPRTFTFLPFFSYTGTGMAVSYILIGIALSVYRYKDVLPACEKGARSKKREGGIYMSD